MKARSVATYAALLVTLLPALFVVQQNARVYHRPLFDATGCNTDVYHQLRYLKTRMHAGAGDAQQELYPEGLVFSHALYGLAWVNLIERLPASSNVYREGMAEAAWALERLASTEAQSTFSRELELPYGAFYTGWSTYLLARIVGLQGDQAPKASIARLDSTCQSIAMAFEQERGVFLRSYTYGTWPADNIVCLAALARRDRARAAEILHSFPTMDGLLPHADVPREAARGSSQSLMLVFLPEIDADYAREHGRRYLDRFIDYRFGLPGVREYPHGQVGRGDVDSGPVVLGMGGAASIVGIAALERLGERALSRQVRNAVEGLGWPLTNGQKKRYFFGQVLMADLFIAWARSYQSGPDEAPLPLPWRFHAWSALLLGLLWVGFRFLRYLVVH